MTTSDGRGPQPPQMGDPELAGLRDRLARGPRELLPIHAHTERTATELAEAAKIVITRGAGEDRTRLILAIAAFDAHQWPEGTEEPPQDPLAMALARVYVAIHTEAAGKAIATIVDTIEEALPALTLTEAIDATRPWDPKAMPEQQCSRDRNHDAHRWLSDTGQVYCVGLRR